MNISRWTVAKISALLLLSATTASAQQSPGAGVSAAVQAGQAAPPRCDSNCVRVNAAAAAEACAPRIEAQSPSDFDWITRPNPGIFQQADPSSPSDAIVRYRGDSVRFMSTDKSWARVSYECGYDVDAKTVSYVQVRSGRLDQPLTPSVAAPAAASNNQGAPARPPAPQAAAPSPAPGSAAPAAHPTRPRVWEPSPVTIQQQAANPKPR